MSVTASVVYGLYKELAPEREGGCIQLPPFDCRLDRNNISDL